MKTSKIVFLLFLSAVFGNLQAQNSTEIDSIRHLIEDTSIDSIKLRLYTVLYESLDVNSRPDLVQLCADSVRSLSKRLKVKDGLYRSHLYYGVLARIKDNNSTAIAQLNKFITYYTQKGDSIKTASGLSQLANVYLKLGDYDKSIALSYRCRSIYSRAQDFVNLARSLNQIGSVFFESRKYEEAIKIYDEAYILCDSLKIDSEKASILLNLGNVHTRIQEYEKAKNYYNQALIINQKLNRPSGIALDLANIAYLYDGRKLYDTALVYHLRALEIREKLPSKDYLARSLIGVGYGYGQLGNYALCTKYLQRALSLTKEIRSKPMTRDIYTLLNQVYAEEYNYRKAYEFHQLYKAVDDSILNEGIAKQINDLQIKYETEKKDQQITLLAQEKEVQQKEAQRQATLKNAFSVGLLMLALLAGLLFYTLRQRLKNQKALAAKNEEISEVNFKRQLTELEMKALQAQINPHFIFNCMNSINQMILDGDNKNASKYLTKFGKLIRMVLENAESTEVSLKDELTLLEAYIQLEALRFDGEIRHTIEINGRIDLENTYLPSMVLQPFVENAIWHGLMHRKDTGNGQIGISIEQQGEQLVCTIEDNGVGRQKAFELQQRSVYKSKSLGLKITEERLKLLSKQVQRKLIHITDLKNQAGEAMGTRVTVNIPIS